VQPIAWFVSSTGCERVEHFSGVEHPSAYLRTAVVRRCAWWHRTNSRRAGLLAKLYTDLAVAADDSELFDVLATLPYELARCAPGDDGFDPFDIFFLLDVLADSFSFSFSFSFDRRRTRSIASGDRRSGYTVDGALQ
jgi:hypothetical protein